MIVETCSLLCMLSVTLNISLIVLQNLTDCEMQMLAALLSYHKCYISCFTLCFLCSDKSYMATVVDFLQDAYSGNKAEDKDKILWVKFEQCSSKGKCINNQNGP